MLKRLILLLLLLVLPAIAATPTYYYVVTAVDTGGVESGFSNQATAAFPAGHNTASLSWTAPTVTGSQKPIAGYNVYRGTATGGPYTMVNTALVTGVTYSDTPFVPPSAPSNLVATVP